MDGCIYIGTSGWAYKSWEKEFYPEGLSAAEHLSFYSTRFPTVEINATFYRLPDLKLVRGWRDKAPAGFVFAVKGSRYITHMKKLGDLDGALDKFFSRLKPLQKQVGPILWQLPPFLKKAPGRLDHFLGMLPDTHRHAVEFRHASWLDEEVFSILRKHDAAHVSVSSMGMPMNLAVTADFVYARFHGLVDGAAHNYTRAELEPWVRHFRAQSKAGRTVYGYFNNDANARAPSNARMLMDMIGKGAIEPSVRSSPEAALGPN